jgi:hypothetical protein
MDRIGDQFLSRSALPCDENRGLARCHTRNQPHHLFHLGASVNDIAQGVTFLKPRPQLPVLLNEFRSLEYFLKDEQKLIQIDGLGQIVKGSRLHAGYRRFHRAISCHHHDREVGIEPSTLERRKPRFWHLEVRRMR